MADIYRVARQCGVILREGHEHPGAFRRPRECFCKPTLREIGREHGEDHLRLVLMLMTGTRSNSAELYADMIKAVSSILARNPELVKRRTLLEDFNGIDLGSLRRKARAMNSGVPTSLVLRVLIGLKFYAPIQGDLIDMLTSEAAA